MVTLARIVVRLIDDTLRWLMLLARSDESVRVENLVLRRQLAMFIERGVRPGRMDAATRISLAVLTRLFDWRSAVVVVQPATIVRWHRAGWRLFWRRKSRPGRPPIPRELRALIRQMGEVHSDVSAALGVRRHRARQPPTDAREHHRASERGLDAAADERSRRGNR